MKIQLCYDPVIPETYVSIDNQKIDKTDIHGFLYPVRRYILQTWLCPSGSWSGISEQLNNLARGDKIELEFCGRKCDYDDLAAALRNEKNINLSFRNDSFDNSFFETKYRKLMDEIDKEFTQISKDNVVEGKKNMSQLFPDEKAGMEAILKKNGDQWLCRVSDDKSLESAKTSWNNCCEIDENYFDSYDKFSMLDDLLCSMRRAEDMILCPVSDVEHLEDLKKYAHIYNFDRVCFYDKKNREVPDRAKEKYGKNHLLRTKIQNYRDAVKILEALLHQIDSLKKERVACSEKIDASSLRKKNDLSYKINWLENAKIHINKIKELLERGVMANGN